MNSTLLTVLLIGGAATGLAFMAAGLLTAEASRRDLARRVQHAVQSGGVGTVEAQPTLGSSFIRTLQWFGQGIRDSAFVSGAAAADLERAAIGAGLNPRNAVPIALAVKVLLLFLCPALAFLVTGLMGIEGPTRVVTVASTRAWIN